MTDALGHTVRYSVAEITEQLQRIQNYTNAELRFLTSADLRGFTQEECLEILDVLKEKRDITVDDLMELGIFTEETRYYRYFFGLFKEDVAGECAALLELSYRLNVQHGTSIYEMSLEEQRMRAEEQMQILTLMVAGLGYSLTEEWLFGPEFDPSMCSPDSMLDMLERDGVNWSFLHEQWVPPSKSIEFSNSAAEVLAQNVANGRAYEQQEFAKFKEQYNNAETQVTIKTDSGTRIRVDAIGLDENGNTVIYEFKSSATAPLTKNQKEAFPQITESGAIVVGKGKGIFTGGHKIPAGTIVEVIRP